MAEKEALYSDNGRVPLCIFFREARSVFKLDELGREIARIAVPAALALTADPIASLVDTAFIGQIGPVELAAVGVSIAVFNQASRIAIFPLVSVTTSFVAEEDTITKVNPEPQDTESQAVQSQDAEGLDTESQSNSENKELIPQNRSGYKYEKIATTFEVVKPKPEKRHIPSASSALIIGAILGLIQAAFLISGAKPILNFMGVKSGSPMLKPAQEYLKLRSLGAPAVLLSLAMQGVFRGFKDTKTPFFATVAGDLTNIILDPIFIFVFHMGVRGAAIAHVISQYLISVIHFWRLIGKVDLLPPSLKHLQFARFLTNGFLLLMRVIAVTFCVTLAASLAARLGPTEMAAFQVCLQVWLATSLLADGLAVAGQAILASAFAQKDFNRATATASRVLQLGLVLGLVLALILGVSLHFGARLFTKDVNVIHLIGIGIPFVAATQPINALAFVFDGVNFGASDFAYSAYSMVYEILQKLLHHFHWIVPGYVMGGESRSKEKARLRKGISILVATPGRLLDHLKNSSSFLYTNLRWIIFDEADRILELGYGKEIEDILNILGSKQQKSVGKGTTSQVVEVQRQNLLLSATLNEKVNHLAEISLDNPVMVGIDKKIELQLTRQDAEPLEFNGNDVLRKDGKPLSSTEEYKLPTQLLQRYIKVPCGSRLVVLLAILKHLFEKESCQKVVVFFSTCDAVDFHYSLVCGFQWHSHLQSDIDVKQLFLKCNTFRLHGNMSHEDRRTTFHAFKTEKSALLLSTDVAARGLDFPKVRCIIQYDPPGEATEYVHRVGRTARIGEKGDSLLFLQPVETDYLHGLEKHGVTLTEYPLQKLLDSFPLFGIRYHPKNFVSLDTHPWVVSLQKALESFTSSELKMKKMAQNAFCSWVRAYTAHRGELKGIFMVKKLHLGHVARSFALKEQPSLVNKSLQKQTKKRMRDQKQKNLSKKRNVAKG